MNTYRFIYLVLICHFFLPDYAISSIQNDSIQFLILPYLKNYFVVFLIFIFFMRSILLNKTLLFRKNNNFLYILILCVLLIYIIYCFIYDPSIHPYADPLSITSVLLPIFLFWVYYEGFNMKKILNGFIFLCSCTVCLMFIELGIYYFYKNPYSISTYNGAFISIIFQNLQIVSIVANLVFAYTIYNLLNRKNILSSILLLMMSIVVCYYTYNRTSLIILVITIPLLAYLVRGFTAGLKYIYFVIFLVFISSFFIDFLETSNITKSDLTDLTSLYTRVVLLYLGSKLFLSNFFLGLGPFSINSEMATLVQKSFSDQIYIDLLYLSNTMTLDTGYWISNPHFAILGAILRYGIISIFIYIAIIKVFNKSYELIRYNKEIILPMIYLLIILFHNLMYPQLYWEFLFLFCISLLYFNREIKNNLIRN